MAFDILRQLIDLKVLSGKMSKPTNSSERDLWDANLARHGIVRIDKYFATYKKEGSRDDNGHLNTQQQSHNGTESTSENGQPPDTGITPTQSRTAS